MDSHYWLFPWLSLIASFISAVWAVFLGRRARTSDLPAPISPALIVVWLITTALLIFGGLKLGDWAATDYIPARGIIAGAIGGCILAAVIRQRTNSDAAITAAVFGFSTSLLCIARLWLTHGEVSGLIATVFSACVTLLCFVVVPEITIAAGRSLRLATLSAAYLTTLAAAVLLGLTRAESIGELYVADVMLIVGAAATVGLLIASSLERFGTVAKAIAVSVTALAVVIPLGHYVLQSQPFIGLVVLGSASVGLPLILSRKSENPEMPTYLGLFLLIASITVAFTLLSGYGLALLTLGVLITGGIAASAGIVVPPSWLSFGSLLLLYRLEILQNGSSVRAIGPADMWDLLSIAIGIFLPGIVESWITNSTLKNSWSTASLWLLAVCAPAIVLDYIWQPRSLTGLFLGLAVGQISSNDPSNRPSINSLSSLLAALLLFLFLPGLDELTAPTRSVRIVSVVILTTIVILRILLPVGRSATKAKVA